jgi:mannitol/fructose-specific phosphotransferase system IIA component (Ntr-type)
LLKHLAELMENPQFQTELQSQKNPQDAYNVIRKYEEAFASDSVE